MKKYEIQPAEIRVKRRESIQLEVITLDVQHGFDVPELGISEPVQPGRPAVFSLPTERSGTFAIECGIICGPMHEEMKGRIVIE